MFWQDFDQTGPLGPPAQSAADALPPGPPAAAPKQPIAVAIARISAIRRRAREQEDFTQIGPMRIFNDGRDPEIEGEPLPLPRRERRILEYLAGNNGRRVTKTQVFNAIYGIFDEDVEENVVESHISKLRKKLREKIGFDPIDSKRFLGYRLVV